MELSVVTGDGAAAGFVAATSDALAAGVGFHPYPGTLNVDGTLSPDDLPVETLRSPGLVNEHCDGVEVRRCSVAGVRSALIRPLVEGYPTEKREILAPVHLRSLFDLRDGERVSITPPDDVWHPTGQPADPGSLSAFDAVVFDLDGTLVDLDVEWPAVHDAVERLLTDALTRPITEYTRAEVATTARDAGLYDEYDRVVAEYENAGADASTALPLLDTLDTLDCAVGVCTANAPSAADRALRAHGVRDAIDAIVGRGTVLEEKPHPRPLTSCLSSLGADAGNSVFVGDDPSDAEAAVAAETSFLHPDQFV